MRWWWILAVIVSIGLGLNACAASMLPAVKLDPGMGPAPPPILSALGEDPVVADLGGWETRRAPLLRRAFAEQVYGPYPPIETAARILSREQVSYPPLAAIADIEQWSVAVSASEPALRFNMVVVLPRDAPGPAPLIVMQNFCGNRAAFAGMPEAIASPLTPVFSACETPWQQPILRTIFGRHINEPPFEAILARGYGVALFYPGDVVADTPTLAREGLAQLYGEQAQGAGAIAAWAWLYSRAYDVLAQDRRIDAARIAIWGHSRNGKAALLAAALDPRIAAVIAHQSGRGGASLSAGQEGESIAKMMEEYPHWFPPAFAGAPSSPAMDQHQLIALIAPRPVFLGNSARDAWSDPHAAWQAARAADPVYRLYGVVGFSQEDMRAPGPQARVQYYTRPGLHGVNARDWRMFLDFLDRQMPGTAASAAAP